MQTTTDIQIKERPILFFEPMVQAILEGRKTMTRRVVKGIALDWLSPEIGFDAKFVADPDNGLCPYGRPGDRLWVRETWARNPDFNPPYDFSTGQWVYRADFDGPVSWNWEPSIHMRRIASRILLEITDVRVERVQDISEDDAKAEGVEFKRPAINAAATGWKHYLCGFYNAGSAQDSFYTLWQSINGPLSWAENPFVWVITFKKI